MLSIVFWAQVTSGTGSGIIRRPEVSLPAEVVCTDASAPCPQGRGAFSQLPHDRRSGLELLANAAVLRRTARAGVRHQKLPARGTKRRAICPRLGDAFARADAPSQAIAGETRDLGPASSLASGANRPTRCVYYLGLVAIGETCAARGAARFPNCIDRLRFIPVKPSRQLC